MNFSFKLGLLAAVLLGGISVTNAQSSLTPGSRMVLRQLRAAKAGKTQELYPASLKMAPVLRQESVCALAKLSDDADIAELEQAGAKVKRLRGNFAMVSMPLNDVERIASHPAIRVMDLGTPYHPHMIAARKSTGIDKIHGGEGLPQAYTGKGVVAGIVDIGIDPNHINFQDENGNNRVKMFANVTVEQTTENAEVKVDTLMGDKLKSFSTDSREWNHGTHTMGIMAGNYRGELSYGNADFEKHEISTVKTNNPFYGIATGSDIAAAGAPTLIPITMAMGMDAILGYAWGDNENDSPERRTVINMSIGTNMGPHDGTDLINQYIDAIMDIDNPIIVLSAGNEGDMNVHVNKTLTEEDKQVSTLIKGLYDDPRYPNYCTGGAQVWSDTADPIDVQVVVYNALRQRVSKRIKLLDDNVGGQYWATSSSYAQEGDIIDSELGMNFHGLVGLNRSVDPESGRFCYEVDFTLWNNTLNNSNEQYIVGIEATGKPGQRIDMYCNSASAYTQFTNMSKFLNGPVPGFSAGSPDGSVSSMACGNNTITVGAYNTKNYYVVPNVNDDTAIYGDENLTLGDVSYFTSYATLADGTTRPHICAPGSLIVSSNNRYYTTYPNEIAATTDGLRPYTWVALQGTSQAAPHVAGAIALWLEADPTLTVGECKDIIAATAVRDDFVKAGLQTQWGAGKFDAYEGLKEVLRRATGIKGVEADKSRLMLSPLGNGNYEIFIAGVRNVNVDVYRADGQRVHHTSADGDQVQLDLARLPKGVYIVNANGKYSQRIIIN